MQPPKLSNEEVAAFDRDHDALIEQLGAAYLSEMRPWTGLPTGPAEELKPKEAGTRLWSNLRSRLHTIICGTGDTAKALESLGVASGSAVFDTIIPGLIGALTLGPLALKLIGIILARAIVSVGRTQLCQALAQGDDKLLSKGSSNDGGSSAKP